MSVHPDIVGPPSAACSTHARDLRFASVLSRGTRCESRHGSRIGLALLFSLLGMVDNGRLRRICFTWNNYPLDAEEQLRCFAERKQLVYMVVGRERGLSGTPHLQGYMHLKHPITFTALKRLLPALHLERARGSGSDNLTYCSKDGDYFEIGELPADRSTAGQATAEIWRSILSAAESGNWDWIKREYPRIWIAFRERLISMRVPRTAVIDGDTQNEWWVGPTGSGKSRLAWEKYGAICFQKMLNKWWDGYDAQPVVVIEEWSPKNEVTASALKIWADRYPFTAQIKGGVLQKIRPTKIIVISNYRLVDCFPDSRDCEPIMRRFRERVFPTDAEEAATCADEFLATLTVSEQVEEPEQNVTMEDTTDTLEDIDLGDLLPDSSQLPILETQRWVDYASDDDFNRLLML